MMLDFVYAGHSGLVQTAGDQGQLLRLAANHSREPVAFDADLREPLRFREAISALHDTVISDLRFKPRDKSAYELWKKDQAERERRIRADSHKSAVATIKEARSRPVPADLQHEFDRARKRYWHARIEYSDFLRRHDPATWRLIMPCDPIVTVADDVVFFECFSADESSYGCLTVDRDGGFGRSEQFQLGTTNVDYSWDLYHQFQKLRSYRATRFAVDPQGIEVRTAGQAEYRQEKIELPPGWLRGFMTLQSAMTMATQRVTLGRETVYSILAFLKRHKPATSPRAMRFELVPGRPPRIVLEPWEQVIQTPGPVWDGPALEPIRIWGTRRLLVLGRLLPLAEVFDVYLLGTGLPSFWVARMGEMRLTLGLSGWTTNDWTHGSALDLLAPPSSPSPQDVASVHAYLQQSRVASLAQVVAGAALPNSASAESALRHLAQTGQVIYDLGAAVYRFRQVMPVALGEKELGPESDELREAREIMRGRTAELTDRQYGPKNTMVLFGKVQTKPVEILIDADQRIRRGKCLCGHYQKFGIRNGPCRHMIALRWVESVSALQAFRQSEGYNTDNSRPGS
jgi:hypothetical protein